MTVIVSLAVLLVSNVWLLKEVERLRNCLDAYQREVLALDERVCRLTVQVELMAYPGLEDALEDGGQTLDLPPGRGRSRDVLG